MQRKPTRFGIPCLFLILSLSNLAMTAHAVDLPIPGIHSATLHGYYKNFLLALESSNDLVEDGVEDLNRARLMLDTRVTQQLDFVLHYEQLATIHPIDPTASSLFLGTSTAGNRPGVLDLSWPILTNDDVQWRQEIDRLYAHRRQSWGDVTVGRQAISWGVGLIWAPQDLFIGFSPVEIDREFRTGIDAARVLVSLGPFTEAEIVYAAYEKEFDQQSAALRWRTTLSDSNVDVELMAGKFFDDVVVGGLAAGQLGGVGLRGEATLTNNFGGGDKRVGKQHFVRGIVGADYRFSGDVLCVAEYYFNGFGEEDAGEYIGIAPSPRFTRGEIFNFGRHYLGFIADWEAHPLLHLLGQGQWNLLDPSAQVGPALSVSLTDEAQLDVGAYFALGKGPSQVDSDSVSPPRVRSEFGLAPNVYYVAGKIYF